MLNIMLSLASFAISTFTGKRKSLIAALGTLFGAAAIIMQTLQDMPQPSIEAPYHIEILTNELNEMLRESR